MRLSGVKTAQCSQLMLVTFLVVMTKCLTRSNLGEGGITWALHLWDTVQHGGSVRWLITCIPNQGWGGEWLETHALLASPPLSCLVWSPSLWDGTTHIQALSSHLSHTFLEIPPKAGPGIGLLGD